MKNIEDKLDRRIREQELICAINRALLEHYKRIKNPVADQGERGVSDGIQDKEHSAYERIIPG